MTHREELVTHKPIAIKNKGKNRDGIVKSGIVLDFVELNAEMDTHAKEYVRLNIVGNTSDKKLIIWVYLRIY